MEEVEKRGILGMSRKEHTQVEIEEGLENLSHYLDGLFRIPGTGWRFGLDSLIGLIPNVGDTITSFASFYILLAGVRYGVPKITLLRMAFNIGLDYLVGITLRATSEPPPDGDAGRGGAEGNENEEERKGVRRHGPSMRRRCDSDRDGRPVGRLTSGRKPWWPAVRGPRTTTAHGRRGAATGRG